MNKYWRATTKDGGFVSESLGSNWNQVSKNITSLELVTDDYVISLPENMEYIQAKTASADLGGGNLDIESRYIGVKLGDHNVIVRVDEKSGNISLEINKS
jgi:hypothetical protein